MVERPPLSIHINRASSAADQISWEFGRSKTKKFDFGAVSHQELHDLVGVSPSQNSQWLKIYLTESNVR
jgi:hypothetical protein